MSSLFDDSEFGNYDYNANSGDTPTDLGGYDQIGGNGGNYSPATEYFDDGMNYNLSNVPQPGWESTGTNWGQIDQQLGTQFNNPMTDIVGGMDRLPSQISPVLANLFNTTGGNKLLSTGLSAVLEGYQNKRKSQQLQQLAQQLKTSGDPFGGQRGFYQGQLQQAVQNPYSSPIVKNQIDAIQQAQNIKDAAAGRRSNSATSTPAVLAAQAKVAQDYINSLYTPSGANLSPNLGYGNVATQAINSGINGYTSPLASALGYNQQSNSNSQLLAEALSKFLNRG